MVQSKLAKIINVFPVPYDTPGGTTRSGLAESGRDEYSNANVNKYAEYKTNPITKGGTYSKAKHNIVKISAVFPALTQMVCTPTRAQSKTRWDISPRSKAKKIINKLNTQYNNNINNTIRDGNTPHHLVQNYNSTVRKKRPK